MPIESRQVNKQPLCIKQQRLYTLRTTYGVHTLWHSQKLMITIKKVIITMKELVITMKKSYQKYL
jgi:hypothetical protein